MPQTLPTRTPVASPPTWSINDFDYEPLTPQAPVAPRASAFSLADFDFEPLAPASPSVPSFEAWYAEQSRQYGLNPNPDTPEQFYDYRAAFKAGASPDETGHWPSQFKRPGHPNEIVGGFNTRTGERVTGTPQASEAELIQRGWSPADAARMSRPQPTFDPNAAGDFAPPPVWTPVDTKIAETRARVPKVDTAPFNPPRFTGIDMNPADPLFAPPAADRAVQGANYTLGGVKQVGKGLVRAAESGVVMRGGPLPVSSIPHPQETMAAASDIMEGVAAAATPLAVAGMLLNAPVTTGAIGATMLASWASGQAADYAGADPETKRFVQNLASTVAAAGGAKLVWDTISPQVQTGLKAVGKDVRAGVLAAKLEAGATPGQAQARGAVGGVPETTSPAFSEPINPEYHINRPSDLGPLSEAVARTKEMIRTGEAPTPETFPSTIPAPSGSVDALMASLAAEKSPRTPRALEIVNLLAQDGKTGTGPDLWTEARQVQGQRGVADVAPETTPRPVVVGPTYDISEGGHIIPTNAAGLAALARPAAPTPTVETPAPSVATPAPAQPAVEAEVVSASEPAPDKAAIRAEMKRRMQEKGILPAETAPAEPVAVSPRERTLTDLEEAGIEPWQVTRGEWVSAQRAERRRLGQSEESGPSAATFSDYENYHKDAVSRAQKAGQPVPASVLADYPDLAPKADQSTEPPRFAPPTTAQLDADAGARKTTPHDAYIAEVTGYGRQNMLNLLHRGGLKAGDGRSDADLAELLWTHFGQPAAEAQARKAQADSVRFAPLSTRQQAESKATLEERKAERGAQVLNAEQADAVMGAKYAVGEQLAEDTNTSGRTLIDWDFKRNTRRQSVLDALGRKDGSVWQAFVADASPQEIEAVSMLVEDARADLAEHGDVSFTDDPRAAIATLAERVGRLQTERGGQVDLFGEPQAPAPAIPQEQGPLVLPEKPPLPSRTATVAEVDAYADALEAYGAKLSGLDAELKRRPYEMPKAWLEQYHDATYDYQENTNVDALRREAIDNEVSSDNVDKARELLRKGEPLTVEELGKALGVHPDSARSLIDVVQDEGDVRVTFDGTAWRGVPEKAELEPSVITPSQPPPVSADLIARKEAEVRSGKLAADPQAVAARLAGKRLVKRGDSFEWRGTRYRFESVDGDDIFTRQADGNAKRRDPQVIAMIERESGVSFDRSTPSRELAEPTKEPVAPSTLPAIPDIPWEGPKPGSPEFASNEVRRRTLADKDDALYQKKVGLEDKLKKTSRTSKLHDTLKNQLEKVQAQRDAFSEELQKLTQDGYDVKLQTALSDADTLPEQRLAIAEKIRERRKLPSLKAYDALKVEAARQLEAAGLTPEEAASEAMDLASTILDFPLSKDYTFATLVPRRVKKAAERKAERADLDAFDAIAKDHNNSWQVSQARKRIQNAGPVERQTIIDEFKTQLDNEKAAREKVAKEEAESEAAREAEIDNEAQVWAAKGQLFYRRIGATKGKGGTWAPTKGELVTIPEVPGYRFWLSKNPLNKRMNLTEEQSGLSAWNGDNKAEAMTDGVAQIITFKDKLAEIVAQHMVDAPPKPALQNWEKPSKAKKTVKKAAAVPEAAVETSTASEAPPDTPVEAASDVEQEVRRVIKTDGMKSGAQIQAAVLKTLHDELAGARHVEQARLDWMNKHSQTEQAWRESHPAPTYPDGANVTREFRAKYSKDVAAHKAAREKHMADTVGPFPYGEEPVITIEIPNDGTFTIKRTVEAINEVMKRVSRSPRKQTWEDLTPAGMAKRGNAMEPRRETGKPTPKPSKFQSFMEAGGSGGSSEAGIGIFAEDIPVTSGTVTTRAIEFPEMVELARELLDTPTVVRAFRKPGKVGEFRPFTGIRLSAELFTKDNERQLAAALAHEIGHLVDWLPSFTLKRGNLLGRLRSLQGFLKGTFTAPDGTVIKNPEVRAELLALSNQWRPWDPAKATPSFAAYRKSGKELYADAISVLLNNPGLLETKAPIFYREFFKALDQKPDVAADYFALQSLLAGNRDDLVRRSRERVRFGMASGEAKALDLQNQAMASRQAERKNLGLHLRRLFVDKNAPVNDLVNKAIAAGVVVPEDEDPRYLLEARNYIGGKQKGFLERRVVPVYDALFDAGVEWADFGEYLFNDRILTGDRSEMANPYGVQPARAEEHQAQLLADLGPDKAAVLDREVRRFRAAARVVAQDAYEAGLYTDDLYAQMQENPAYAPFRVVEYMDTHVNWQVLKQIGTLKAVGNPADAFVLKMLATIRAIERQTVTTGVVDWLQTHEPTEIEDAKTRWTGKTHEPVDPRDNSQGLLTYYVRGRRVGKYVDKIIADSVLNESIGRNGALMTILNWVSGAPIFRPLFTTFNLGWQGKNAIRDFTRLWSNAPGMSLAKALALYAKAVPAARLRAFGLKKGERLVGVAPGAPMSSRMVAQEALMQAEEAEILSVTYNDLGRSSELGESELEHTISTHGVQGLSKSPAYAMGVQQVVELTRFVQALGDFIETLPKMAAIDYFSDGQGAKALTPAQRSFIRKMIGTPDLLAGGTLTPATNKLAIYSNAAIQGNRSDWHLILHPEDVPRVGVGPSTRPPRASAVRWKLAGAVLLPKLIMRLMLLGLFGEVLREIMQNGSTTYDRRNNIVVPLASDARGNGIIVKIPPSEFGKTMGGLFDIALDTVLPTGTRDIPGALTDLVDYSGGQLPSVSPLPQIMGNLGQKLAGGRVYDAFRGRFVLSEDEAAAGGTRAWKKYLSWQLQQAGAGAVWKWYIGQDRPEEKTRAQQVLDLPIASLAQNFIRITSYGETERLREVQQTVRSNEAERRLSTTEALNTALRAYQQLPPPQQTKATQRRLAREIVAGIEDLPKADRAERERAIEKRIRMGVIRGKADPLVDAVMSATSTAQKVAILTEAAKSQVASDFSTWLVKAKIEGVISEDVYTTTRRALKQAPPAGVRR